MIQNNLDNRVAQHPHELITYGGNGAVFQNWAQYLLTMKYLAEMTDEQTLVMYSGHPMGLFPSNNNAPRVVVTNGMVIPNYSKKIDLEKFNALGVSQYGQMTAGSYMYIGPQGIVHGTTITVLNAFRKINKEPKGKIFVTSGLGGMSGAQPKAGNIAGCITVCAEINIKAIKTRHSQNWVDEVIDDLKKLKNRFDSFLAGCVNKKLSEEKNKILLIGPVNSGKSSVFNRLLGYERALVSKIPGTTRDLISSELFYASSAFSVFDSAGIRETDDEIEGAGIEVSLSQIKEADLVLGI